MAGSPFTCCAVGHAKVTEIVPGEGAEARTRGRGGEGPFVVQQIAFLVLTLVHLCMHTHARTHVRTPASHRTAAGRDTGGRA
jgi:hypothetical protein